MPDGLPFQFFIKVECTDRAGNVGSALTQETVKVDLVVPKISINAIDVITAETGKPLQFTYVGASNVDDAKGQQLLKSMWEQAGIQVELQAALQQLQPQYPPRAAESRRPDSGAVRGAAPRTTFRASGRTPA